MIIKNSNLRTALYYNRYKILGVIVAIILLFVIIHAMNEYAKDQLKINSEQGNIIQNNTNTYRPEETIISGYDVPKEQQQMNNQIIDEFISYCNEGKIEEAYHLLTDECKEQIFSSSIENFKQDYINVIFNTKKTYHLQSWITGITYTYKIRIVDDMLSTGHVSSVENAIEDYYTLIKKDNQYRLNIGSYIGREDIGQEVQKGNLKITIISKDIYREYEKYNFKIENHTENTICMDTKQKNNTMYLWGENDRKYTAYYHELQDTKLLINAGNVKSLTIKYNKIYSNQVKINSIVFEDIIPNYDVYKQLQDKTQYQDKLAIEIKI